MFQLDPHINEAAQDLKAKAREWCFIVWLDNVVPDWERRLQYLQLPYCYCIHDKDHDSVGNPRKLHAHVVVVASNTTTRKFMLTSINSILSLPGSKCCNTVFAVLNIRWMYNYLIHDTVEARKEGKYLYDPSDRHECNGFDIGILEQLSVAEQRQMRKELSLYIIEHNFFDYTSAYLAVMTDFDDRYLDIMTTSSSHFERITKGNYLRSLN